MKEKKLRYFIAVADTQNISKAAEQLYLAQPALSKVIASIEEELGYLLFDRVGKNIVLNQNGILFYKYAKKILIEYENAREALAEENHRKTAPLRIGVCASSQLLSALLSQFQKESKEIIHIQVKSTFPLDFDRDEIDLMIDAEAQDTDREGKQNLLCEKILLALPKGHPLLLKEKIYLADTMEYPYILPAENTRMGQILHAFFREQSVSYPKNATIVNNSYVQCEMVAQGLGISFLPEKSWIYAGKLENLKLCSIEGVSLQRTIFFEYHPNRYHSKALKSFGCFLERFYKEELFRKS